ncbi:MAG: Ldh family oxidoreductase [Hyphomicrobiales bacterium]
MAKNEELGSDVLIDATALGNYLTDIFAAAGCEIEEARRVSLNLLEASLTGHDSHGVIRTPRYLLWVKSGNLVPGQDLSVDSDQGALAILDGRFGFGQTVGPQAVRIGLEKANKHGLSVIALKQAGHLGRIGAFAEMAAAENMVSIHFVNVAGSILVAPFGGTDRRISTAPIAIGVPVPDAKPVILDFATSTVAEGKVLVAAKGGKPLPNDSLIGPDGTLSGDPSLLYGDADPSSPDLRTGEGAITAMGLHKGSGLAVMCELLAGALTGSGATGEHYSRIHNGMLSIYLPVERFESGDTYGAEIRRYIDYVKSSNSAVEGAEILVPGEPEEIKRAERMSGGVPLSADAWNAICDEGTSYGISAPRPLNQ